MQTEWKDECPVDIMETEQSDHCEGDLCLYVPRGDRKGEYKDQDRRFHQDPSQTVIDLWSPFGRGVSPVGCSDTEEYDKYDKGNGDPGKKYRLVCLVRNQESEHVLKRGGFDK